jgi:hypothetical protein
MSEKASNDYSLKKPRANVWIYPGSKSFGKRFASSPCPTKAVIAITGTLPPVSGPRVQKRDFSQQLKTEAASIKDHAANKKSCTGFIQTSDHVRIARDKSAVLANGNVNHR